MQLPPGFQHTRRPQNSRPSRPRTLDGIRLTSATLPGRPPSARMNHQNVLKECFTTPRIRFSPEDDAISVTLRDARVTSGRSFDNNLIHVYLDENRQIVGISFLYVSHGINLGCLPPELLGFDDDPDAPLPRRLKTGAPPA